ncbi:MAG: DMT family transporter [Proteobacteria bacterium]|nr:DMT family transporter [Pseudomonadota bacterium]
MTSPTRVVLLTALAMLAFAGNSLLCRIALRDTAIDPASFTALRIGSGALILALLLRSRGARPATGGSWMAALALFSYAAFFSFAYRELSAATGALLLFGAVQMTMMGFGLFSGERLGGIKLVGLAVALGGLVALLLPGLSAPPAAGAALMAAAGISWGVYSILGKSLGEPIAATGGNFMRALPFAAALALTAVNHSSIDLHGAAYAIASGAVTSGLGYVIWYAALPSLKATQAAIVQLSVPAIAALGGALLLAEPITGRLLLASAAILGGIALTTMGKRPAK